MSRPGRGGRRSVLRRASAASSAASSAVSSAAVAAALLLAGCGLPVQPGVQSADPVAQDTVERGAIQVLPPGPRTDAGPREVVLGFLGAQTSPDGAHALAREFLAPEVRDEWDAGAGVVVYDPATLDVTVDPDDPSRVVVRSATVARIGDDGGYLLDPGTTEDVYRLRRDGQGELRLAEVPAGLRLTPAGTGRSFSPQEVFFLSPSGTPRPADRLVPDRVFLAADAGADALVRQLLDGPSLALRDAVETAVPEGTALRQPVAVTEGVVTVDLTREAASAGPAQRRQLSAQLVWTVQTGLPGTSSVRLLVDGRPFDVPDVGAEQDRADWAAYDPAGPTGRAAVTYVAERRLQRLDGSPTRSPATDGQLPVDAAVASPSTGRLALLTRGGGPSGGDVVRTGSPAGPFTSVLSGAPVTSLSWGSGNRGLWVVTGETNPSVDPVLALVPATDGQPVQRVQYVRPVGAGPLVLLRISRDGARAAAVFGQGAQRRLHVGRVEQVDGGLRLAGLRSVAPGLADVADVAWESGTSLVLLAPFGTTSRLPVRVAVDGSEVEPVRTLGLDGEPQSVTAAPGRPLVVGAVLAGRPVLLVEDGGLFRLQPGTGSAPAYPG
jgi:hypothetical protein